VTCRGRIVEGTEADALRQQVEKELAQQSMLVLNLRDVDFIDSSGLGLLVRLAMRLRNEGGELKLCGASARTKATLKTTRVNTLFKSYESEAEAVSAFSLRPQAAAASSNVDVLCATRSADLLAYLGQLLRQAGYAVSTTDNLAEAETMLAANRPKVVVIDSYLSAAVTGDASLRARFNLLIDGVPILELPAEFSTLDAGDAGRQLLKHVRAAIS
jgi:anti-anti-sigma factor